MISDQQTEEMLRRIEAVRKSPITPEEEEFLVRWQDGQLLAQLIAMPGWKTFRKVVTDELFKTEDHLRETEPGTVPAEVVIARHAHMYAANKFYEVVLSKVQSMVDDSHKPPQFMQEVEPPQEEIF
jgi:hypothetical protein